MTGYSTDQPEGFERRRAVERKHGRIAMMAMLGCLIHNADIEFPGYLSLSQKLKFSDIPDGMMGITKVPAAGKLMNIMTKNVVRRHHSDSVVRGVDRNGVVACIEI